MYVGCTTRFRIQVTLLESRRGGSLLVTKPAGYRRGREENSLRAETYHNHMQGND